MAFLRGLRVLWLLVLLLVLTFAFAQEGAAGRYSKESAQVRIGTVSFIDL